MCPTREKSYYLAANFNTSFIYIYIYLHHMQIWVQRNNVLIQDVFYELGGAVQSQHIRPGGLSVQVSLGYNWEILPQPCTKKSIVYLSFENKLILLILSCNFYLQIHRWKSTSVLCCHHEMEDKVFNSDLPYHTSMHFTVPQTHLSWLPHG